MWKHLKRGTTYDVVTANASLQCAKPEIENAFSQWTVYRSREDGHYWVRPTPEFEDGRYIEMANIPVVRKFTALVDLDHTLSNAFWRDPMIGGFETWNAYHSASVDDKPVASMVALINALHEAGWQVVAFTMRPEKFRTITQAWLLQHGVMIDEVLMREDEQYHPAPETKMELALKRFGESMKNEITVVFDDREDVVLAFQQAGITAVQVHVRRD